MIDLEAVKKMLVNIEGYSRSDFAYACSDLVNEIETQFVTPNPIQQGEAIFPTALDLEVGPFGSKAKGFQWQQRLMQVKYDLENQLAEANKEIERWKLEAETAIAHANDFKAEIELWKNAAKHNGKEFFSRAWELTQLTEQHAKAVECIKWYIDKDMGDKAKTCLKELGVKI